jgi:hypothetical protein
MEHFKDFLIILNTLIQKHTKSGVFSYIDDGKIGGYNTDFVYDVRLLISDDTKGFFADKSRQIIKDTF